jgi:phage gp36-like protein
MTFDRKCCHLAAYMFIEEKKNGYIEEGLKQKIKVDIQILSIVQSSNSLVFYTEDDKLLKLAERHCIKTSRLPEVDPSQIPLFIEI